MSFGYISQFLTFKSFLFTVDAVHFKRRYGWNVAVVNLLARLPDFWQFTNYLIECILSIVKTAIDCFLCVIFSEDIQHVLRKFSGVSTAESVILHGF